MSLEFIKDVIYGLKQEYGQPGTFRNRSTVADPATGELSGATTSQYVHQVIALPLDRRTAFLKSVGVHNTVNFEQNQQQFLIDIDDLNGFKVRADITRLEYGGYEQDVKFVETYSHALIVTTTAPNLQ